jgi:hypothetical protein
MPNDLRPFSFGNRSCGCKGIRTCLTCEKENPCINKLNINSGRSVFYFCKQCDNKSWSRDLCNHQHHCHQSESQFDNTNLNQFVIINGVSLFHDVITSAQETEIVKQIDSSIWNFSQSGRRKQDFGPKVNFKKQKVKVGDFKGLPGYAISLFDQLKSKYSILKDFLPVELCNLDYDPKRGSSIVPHLDDDWIWGERLVTLNLLSPTKVILSPIVSLQDQSPNCEIWIELPARSLIVLTNEARYNWYHEIRREHIKSRRIAMTFREFTQPFLPQGQFYESIGKNILTIAKIAS